MKVTTVELNQQPASEAGSFLSCHRCGQQHLVHASDEGSLHFVRCQGKTFLVGLDGRSLVKVFQSRAPQ